MTQHSNVPLTESWPVERNVTWNVVWCDSRQDTKKTNLVAYNLSQENDSYFYKDMETSRA